MSDNEQSIIESVEEIWAILELMGHGQTSGRIIQKPGDWGGLLRVDVPSENDSYRTEFYSMSAIYSIRIVSEEIARAYAPKSREIASYDTPIVTREQHISVVDSFKSQVYQLEEKIRELERRLTSINVLDSGEQIENGPPF